MSYNGPGASHIRIYRHPNSPFELHQTGFRRPWHRAVARGHPNATICHEGPVHGSRSQESEEEADRLGSKRLDLLDGGNSRVDRALCLRQGDLALVNCSVEKTAMKRSLLIISTMGLLWSTCAYALDEEQQHGKELLQKLCARCHSVGRTGASPNRQAPPFRSFSETKLYDSDFMQRLQDGLTSIHRDMPTFKFNRSDASAAINYLKSIQDHRKQPP